MAKLRSTQFRKTIEGSAVFSDYIYTEKVKHTGGNIGSKSHSMRTLFLFLALFISITILFGRVFFLQIIKGSYYRALSNSNRIKTVVIHAARGIIFDRNGIPLVYNMPGFRESSPDGREKTRFLSQEAAISILAKGKNDLEVDALRQYPFKDAFAHVLGYIGQISKEELTWERFKNYRTSDVLGKMGIEEEYEGKLKGVDGGKLIEVDSLGREIRTIGQQDPIPGGNITLTLDSALQKVVFAAFSKIAKGAVLVTNPQGEVLALVSKPSFDPNLFTLGEGYSAGENSAYQSVGQILSDSENQPFLNRAISGTYPPGSTFKPIVVAAGLENKIIDENYEVEDTGVLRVGSFSFSNWYYSQYGRTEGMVNVVSGIKRSNDIFFYNLAQKIGVDKISEMAKKFKVGSALGIDLKEEAKGLLPTVEWKQKTLGEQWFLGDTYHFGIGQGYLLVTPLQVNTWTQAIANNGTLYKLHLNKELKPQVLNSNFLSNKTVDLIREGMIESCSPGGVAWPLFEFKVKGKEIKIACKTGTAQHGGENTLPHAWITLFAPAKSDLAPANNPQIIVTVLAEDSGEGSNIAAPIAKKILEEWFGR